MVTSLLEVSQAENILGENFQADIVVATETINKAFENGMAPDVFRALCDTLKNMHTELRVGRTETESVEDITEARVRDYLLGLESEHEAHLEEMCEQNWYSDDEARIIYFGHRRNLLKGIADQLVSQDHLGV